MKLNKICFLTSQSIPDDDLILKFKNFNITYIDTGNNKFIFTNLIIITNREQEGFFIGHDIKGKYFINFPINNIVFKREILDTLFNCDLRSPKVFLKKVIELKKKLYYSNNIFLFKIKGNNYVMNNNSMMKFNQNYLPKIEEINKEFYITKIYIPLFNAFMEEII